jgi:hypothetical protein
LYLGHQAREHVVGEIGGEVAAAWTSAAGESQNNTISVTDQDEMMNMALILLYKQQTRLHEKLTYRLKTMSTQAAGNTYLPFVDLMRLETINEVTYRSTAQPFCPGGSLSKSMGRAYGGHVYAQAAWAAAQTVPEGFVLHVSFHTIRYLV